MTVRAETGKRDHSLLSAQTEADTGCLRDREAVREGAPCKALEEHSGDHSIGLSAGRLILLMIQDSKAADFIF